jgi:hypothetical protein
VSLAIYVERGVFRIVPETDSAVLMRHARSDAIAVNRMADN